jgi:ribonuclease Z
MPKLIILGSANAIPAENQENTHLALVGRERVLLIDCVSNPLIRLRQAGVEPAMLTDLILTHFHPDHVSGVPLLLMNMWLLGRQQPLSVYGLDYTLERVEKLMDAYEWSTWPNFFPVEFKRLPERELTPVLESEEWRVYASPVCHLIPTIGLRFEFPQSEKVMAYSCDTEPCPQVVKLAQGADVLIHEAAGGSPGHSAPAQAGAIAREAGAKALYLIHYPSGDNVVQDWPAQAGETFGGPVKLAQDFMELEF